MLLGGLLGQGMVLWRQCMAASAKVYYLFYKAAEAAAAAGMLCGGATATIRLLLLPCVDGSSC